MTSQIICLHNLTFMQMMHYYTDPSTLYIADMDILQNDLNTLDHWASTWLMAFNPSKCEFLQITKKILPINTHYHICR